MKTQSVTQVRSTSDAAVAAKTGKTWGQWFRALDRHEAAKLDHQSIVRLLVDRYGVPSWWRQMIAVEYERERGLRARHQGAGGFSVSVSKTLSTDVSQVYAASAETAVRKTWFPKGRFEQSSATHDKYLRGSWKGEARLEIGFTAKAGKAQIAVQVGKLARAADVEVERAAWKAALAKLQDLLAD